MGNSSQAKMATYAVVRIDAFQDGTVEWQNRIKVTKILMDLKSAETEVDRLVRLNANKGVIYFWQKTHLEETHRQSPGSSGHSDL